MIAAALSAQDAAALIGPLFETANAAEAPRLARAAAEEIPAAAADLLRFAECLDALEPARREEVCARTFDLMPSCAPYLSVHLFGEESFKRSMLMTGLAEAYSREGFDRGTELPDHIAVALRFAPRFAPEEWREFAQFCLPAPLLRMKSLLEPSDNPYRHAVAALQSILATEFPAEVLPCSTSSSSAPFPTSLCSSCSSAPSGDTEAAASATPRCPLSSSRTDNSSGAPSPGMQASWPSSWGM